MKKVVWGHWSKLVNKTRRSDIYLVKDTICKQVYINYVELYLSFDLQNRSAVRSLRQYAMQDTEPLQHSTYWTVTSIGIYCTSTVVSIVQYLYSLIYTVVYIVQYIVYSWICMIGGIYCTVLTVQLNLNIGKCYTVHHCVQY